MNMDRRSARRLDLEVTAVIEIKNVEPNTGCGRLIRLSTCDVSSDGAYFRVDTPLPVGTRVVVDLVLLQKNHKSKGGEQALVKMDGEVARADQDGMAVVFREPKNYLTL